jgi:tRNA threonylcarbamoyladenosine biosynthesis protein TsaB
VIHLAVETSTSVIDMALLEEDRLLCSVGVHKPGGASEILIHGLESLLTLSGLKAGDIGLVSSSEGPGTYTSLRVGHLFCQGFSFSLGVPHRTVSPFSILAEQVHETMIRETDFLVVVLDARRGEVNARVLLPRAGGRPGDPFADQDGIFSGRAVDPALVLGHLPPGSGLVTGPGGSHLQKILPSDSGQSSRIRVYSDLPRAETMGRIAWRREMSGPGTSGPSGSLIYGRDSVIP